MYLWRSASLVYVSPRETGPAARSVGVSGLPADVQDSTSCSEYMYNNFGEGKQIFSPRRRCCPRQGLRKMVNAHVRRDAVRLLFLTG